jgi:hypothetical protein
MSDELKERQILKLILIVRFACATLDVGHTLAFILGTQIRQRPFVWESCAAIGPPDRVAGLLFFLPGSPLCHSPGSCLSDFSPFGPNVGQNFAGGFALLFLEACP